MREIKYRAWDKKRHVMSEPFSFYDLFYTTDDDGVHFGNSRGFTSFNHDLVFIESTGLKDKNGKEIFEGDIIKITSGYDSGLKATIFRTEVLNDLRVPPFSYGCNPKGLEVIGNIYEHKELLA